jgi:hypothetical protein
MALSYPLRPLTRGMPTFRPPIWRSFYPGAAEAYDRALAVDRGFALAHAGKAQVLM